jgi:hypothetical protein
MSSKEDGDAARDRVRDRRRVRKALAAIGLIAIVHAVAAGDVGAAQAETPGTATSRARSASRARASSSA